MKGFAGAAACALGLATAGLAHAQQGRPLDFAALQMKTTRLADNIYVVEAAPGVGNVVFITGPDGVLLVDSMFPQLHDKLMAAIRAAGATGPIRYVVNTHLHNDHTAGNGLMVKEGATVVAQDNVRTRMLARKADGAPAYPAADIPTLTYATGMTLHFDGEDIEITHPPAAHTDGDSIVYFKHANVMQVGDLPASLRFNNIGVDDGGSVDGMIADGKLVMRMANPQTKIVPGHLGPVVGFKEITIQEAMFQTVRDRIAKMIAEGKTLQQAIDAKPTADFNEGRLGGNITPERWVTLIYTDLSRRAPRAK
jgi:cyclase